MKEAKRVCLLTTSSSACYAKVPDKYRNSGNEVLLVDPTYCRVFRLLVVSKLNAKSSLQRQKETIDYFERHVHDNIPVYHAVRPQ